MDVTINKDLLVREFGLARRLGERKATIPTYSYARVEADFGRAHVSATDGEAALETVIPAMDVGEAGVMLVPIRTLHEAARASAAEGVRLSKDGDRLLVQSGGFKSRLATLPVEQFPDIAAAPEASVALPTAVLRRALDKTRFVVESGSGRTGNPSFHGALLKLTGKQLEFVATDGYRIAHVASTLNGDGKGATSAVQIPKKAMDDLSAVLAMDPAPETVGYATDGAKAHFTVDQRRFVTRLIDAKYPAYEKVMPKLAAPSADADRDAWLGVLRRVMLVSSEESTKVVLALAQKAMRATMESATVGNATEAFDVAITGDGWTAAFDAKYLAEFLAAADAGTIRFCQAAPNAGAVLQSIEGPIEYKYCVMPISL